MNLPGVDCSQPISGAALKAAGKEWVGRYLADHPTGDLTATEVADLHAHGIGILLLREYSTDDLGSETSARGAAEQAIAKASALGAPPDCALVLCEDNVNPNTAAVEANMADAAILLRGAGFLAGCYGRKDIARALGGRVDVTFPVDTWGADQPGDRWNFRQLPNPPDGGQVVIGGVTCDIDDAPNPIGLWLPAPAPPPPPPVVTPIPGEHMREITLTINVAPDPGHDGFRSAGYGDVGEFAESIIAVDIGGADPVPTGTYAEFDAPTWEAVAVGTTRIQLTSQAVFTGPVTVRVFCVQ